ncbi:type II secretion system protein [Haloplasma contractile]|uniref:XcmT3 protein n=1 Tax=Haloplasma contractile SSD-17B TaxID=1033810 RepID=U2FM46_9MOLU|nr:type II secretion system protein [Haloplasma contractile]ERJ13800.1 XcmT3 protein [Haloplasma contractile SSD-17B]
MLNKKGMTLMELLAVIVILGIVAAIAVPSVGKLIDNSKQRTVVENANTAVSAARNFATANDVDLGGEIDFVNFKTNSYTAPTGDITITTTEDDSSLVAPDSTSTSIQVNINALILDGYLPESFLTSDPYGSYVGNTSYVLISKSSSSDTFSISIYLNGSKYDVEADLATPNNTPVKSDNITTDNVIE